MMWSCVSWSECGGRSPSSRSKHSVTLLGGFLYLLAGRNGNIPLKDLWRYSLSEGSWEMLDPGGERPPCLQEHTSIPYKDSMYVFGGEIGFSSCNEAPLWIYNSATNMWRKVRGNKGANVPKGRRGHTAVLYKSQMLIYGGYRDLRGSSNELWSFHLETETWHLLSSSRNGPSPRHKHSMVLHDDAVWVYGGMTDLQEKADFWRFDLVCKKWNIIKTKLSPGSLHSHAACKLPSSMLVFGGERTGQANNELWKFHFGTETWEKIVTGGVQPHARSESVALKVPELLMQGNSLALRNSPVTRRCRGGGSVDRQSSRNRWLEAKRAVTTPTASNLSILKEISKLSQLNLSKLSQPKYSYTVLSSNESLNDNGIELKCQSVNILKNVMSPSNNFPPLPRDPVSVPNFSLITSCSLTPVEVTTKLDDDDKQSTVYRSRRGFPKSASVRFSNPINTPEESVEETSDYASLETVNKTGKTPLKDMGPFSFENPNYMGPDIKSMLSQDVTSPADSVLEDSLGRSDSSQQLIEMKPLPPRSLPLSSNYNSSCKKLRACSASRADSDFTSFCIFIIGGKERGQVTVFRRPLSFWKLELNSNIY